MATVVETSSLPTTPKQAPKLVVSSLIGAIYVLAALAVVLYAVPALWRENISPNINGPADVFLRICAQLGVVLLLTKFGQTLAGANPPKGIRGGIFLMISFAITIFFIVRAVGMNIKIDQAAMIAMAVVGGVMLFFTFRLFTSPRGENWMVGLEEQGWFGTHAYKRALGHKVRRLTMLGIILVGGTGVYSLLFTGSLPQNWVLGMPLMDKPITVLTDLRIAGPFFLMALTLWVAYRAVNLPMFAEFLIATEAEMNKVSWSSAPPPVTGYDRRADHHPVPDPVSPGCRCILGLGPQPQHYRCVAG